MFFLLAIIWFLWGTVTWWIVIWAIANAYIIPTYFPWDPLFTFEKSAIISAIILIILFVIFSPKINSYRLNEYMKNWYSEPSKRNNNKN